MVNRSIISLIFVPWKFFVVPLIFLSSWKTIFSVGLEDEFYCTKDEWHLIGLNEIVHPDKSSPGRKKHRHDLSYYEQELRNKLNGSSPIRPSHSTTPTTSPILAHSPTRNSTTTTTVPTPNHAEKSKPRILTKRMGLKRAVMQKLKITKNAR